MNIKEELQDLLQNRVDLKEFQLGSIDLVKLAADLKHDLKKIKEEIKPLNQAIKILSAYQLEAEQLGERGQLEIFDFEPAIKEDEIKFEEDA